MKGHLPRRQFLRDVPLGLAAGAALVQPVAARRATEIDTCMTITERGRYVVTGDISHGSGVCLRIEASNVTVDGNGHAIGGSGASDSHGVLTSESARGVTVRDLEVTGMNRGFNLNGPGARFDGVVATGNRSGFLINSGAERTRVTNSVISANDQNGISAIISGGHTFEHNTVESNGNNGVFFRQGCSGCTIRWNSIRHNGDRGVGAWEGGDGNRLIGNTAESNGLRGISINDTNPDRARNLFVQGNTLAGNNGDGLFLRRVDGSRIIGNTVLRNTDDGIDLDDSDNNRLIRNVVCDNNDEAIVVRSNSTGNRLQANTVEC